MKMRIKKVEVSLICNTSSPTTLSTCMVSSFYSLGFIFSTSLELNGVMSSFRNASLKNIYSKKRFYLECLEIFKKNASVPKGSIQHVIPLDNTFKFFYQSAFGDWKALLVILESLPNRPMLIEEWGHHIICVCIYNDIFTSKKEYNCIFVLHLLLN